VRLDSGQLDLLLRLVEETPWGDIEGAMESCEAALRRALEATRADFEYWQENCEAAGLDEFSLEPSEIDGLSEESQRAYFARLLRSAALHYGLGTEFGGELGVPQHSGRDTLAVLLHELVDIASHPTRDDLIRRSIEELKRSLDAADRDRQHRPWYLTKAEAQARQIADMIRLVATEERA